MRVIVLSLTFFILITLSLVYIWILKRKLQTLGSNFLKIKRDYLKISRANKQLNKRVYKLRNRLVKVKKSEHNLMERVVDRVKNSLMIVANELDRYNSNEDHASLVKAREELGILLKNDISTLPSRHGARPIVINLSQLLQRTVENRGTDSELRKIKLKATIEEGIFIKEEPVIVTTIINNLLNNALNHAELAPNQKDGVVKVVLKSSLFKVFITIKDNGPGFAENPESNTLRLGLKLTESALKYIGGSLTIMSSPGKGTECAVTLVKACSLDNSSLPPTPPLRKSTLPQIDLSRLAQQYPLREGLPNILVLSLDESFIRLLTDYLHPDFNIEQALTSQMAIYKLKSNPNISLLLLDLPLQNNSTSALLKTLADEYPQIVLAITADKDRVLNAKNHLCRLTTVIYTAKPFNLEDFHRKLKFFFKNSQNTVTPVVSSTLNKNRSNLDIFAASKMLTSREKDILLCIVEGKTLKETSRELAISIETVKKYRQKLFTKLEVKSAREIFPKYFR